MEHLHKIKKLLKKELEELSSHNNISMSELDVIHKLTDTIKNIDKIVMLERQGDGDDGYSRRYGRGYSHTGESDDMSRTGNMNQNRDWYGRHSRDDGRRMMTSEVENLMGRLSGHDREILERLMEQLQNA